MITKFKIFTLAFFLNSVAYAQPSGIKNKMKTASQCPGQNINIAVETLTTADDQGIE